MIFRSIVILISTLLLLSSCATTSTSTSKSNDKSEMTLAFGSCNHADDPQPLWNKIAKANPDVWIWMGDIVYGDTEDMSVLKGKYDMQARNQDYAAFSRERDVIGIWDDHDYGTQDGGAEYAKKDSSKMMMFDFLDVPADHPSQSRDGAYQSYIFEANGLKVKVLLLDARYFRGTPNKNGETMLGNEQWKWLIGHFSANEADVHVITSGVQILPTQHRFEKWANFKNERARLLNILDQIEVNNPVLISGDRHIGEMTLQGLPQSGEPILEITSSGLTHYYESFSGEENDYRVGEVAASLNFGLLKIKKDKGIVSFEAEIKDDKNKTRVSISSSELEAQLGQIEAANLKSK